MIICMGHAVFLFSGCLVSILLLSRRGGTLLGVLSISDCITSSSLVLWLYIPWTPACVEPDIFFCFRVCCLMFFIVMWPGEKWVVLSFLDTRCLLQAKCQVPWRCGDVDLWWDDTIWQPGQNDGPKIKRLMLFNCANPLNWRLSNLYLESLGSHNWEVFGAPTGIVDSLPLAAEEISIETPSCMTERVWVQLRSMSVCAIMSCRMLSVMMDDWILLWNSDNIWWRISYWGTKCEFNHSGDRGREVCEFTQDCNHLYDGEKQWFEFTQHKAMQVISKKWGQDVNVWIHTRHQGTISKYRSNVCLVVTYK